MPTFYFDIDDGERQLPDRDGIDLLDANAARDQAIAVLPNIAREVLPDGGQRTFVVAVRDADGTALFRAKLVLTSEWLVPR